MDSRAHAISQDARRAAIPPRLGLPDLGLGIGLRSAHFRHLLAHWPALDWFELISENYLDCHGWRREVLRQIAERYPVVMHGVSLSIGSCDALDLDYLRRLKALALEIDARWISDHLCWTGVAGQNTHDLLPLPLNETTLAHVVARIRTTQDLLERPLVLENPSSYLRFQADSMPEWEFLARMADAADCGLLLDVNNVYVSSVNHGFDAQCYIDALPFERIVQIHVAGHRDCGNHIIDTHDGPVSDPVWALYRHAIRRTGPVSTLLEWDAQIPSFEEVRTEVHKAGWQGRATADAKALTLPSRAPGYAPANAPMHEFRGAHPSLAGAAFDA